MDWLDLLAVQGSQCVPSNKYFIIFVFFQKKILSEAESKLVEQQLAEENKLLKEQENIQELVFNLVRMTQIKIDEKEQKSKDFLKAQVTAFL